MTPQELRLEAARLLASISTQAETIQACRQIAAKLPPGGVTVLATPGLPGRAISREDLLRVARDIEAEIASIRQQAKELQELSFVGKG